MVLRKHEDYHISENSPFKAKNRMTISTIRGNIAWSFIVLVIFYF